MWGRSPGPPHTLGGSCEIYYPLTSTLTFTYFPPGECLRLKSSMPFERDWALQNIPSLSQNNSSKRNPKLWMMTKTTLLEVLNLICPATGVNKRIRTLSLPEVELDGWFLILRVVLETCTMWFMHKFWYEFWVSISIFLDWRLGFERDLRCETHMRASILNIAPCFHPSSPLQDFEINVL